MPNTPKPVSEPGPPETVEAEIYRLAELSLDELRVAWRLLFRKAAPKALWRDLLLRIMIWQVQANAFGGHDKATERLLDGYGKKGKGDWRQYQRIKAGTVLVREYEGVRHTVTLGPEGFIWEEKIYSSLSAIAKIITGCNWNGPRFFGLREVRPGTASDDVTRAA